MVDIHGVTSLGLKLCKTFMPPRSILFGCNTKRFEGAALSSTLPGPPCGPTGQEGPTILESKRPLEPVLKGGLKCCANMRSTSSQLLPGRQRAVKSV